VKSRTTEWGADEWTLGGPAGAGGDASEARRAGRPPTVLRGVENSRITLSSSPIGRPRRAPQLARQGKAASPSLARNIFSRFGILWWGWPDGLVLPTKGNIMKEKLVMRTQSNSKNLFDTLGTDFIHITYNLLYPAVLGSFFYEAAQHLTKPIPHIRLWWFARGLLIILYCMDFMVAKKFYTAHLPSVHGIRMTTAILVEALTVGSLLFAYWSEDNRTRFFTCLCLFIAGTMIFNFWIDRSELVAFTCPIVGLVVCLVALFLPYSDIYFKFELGVASALVIAHYLLGIYFHPVLKSRISVSGELLDYTPVRQKGAVPLKQSPARGTSRKQEGRHKPGPRPRRR
jgi:hypothetical protein